MKLDHDFFETLVNVIGGGVVVTNSKGEILFVNAVVHDMLGYSKEELMGLPVSKITDPSDLDSTEEVIKEAITNPGTEVQLEKIYLTKKGKRFYGITTVKSQVIKGEVCLLAFINDFTSQYLGRQRVERQYKNIVELADDIIFTVDPIGNFTYVNEQAQELTGLSEKALLDTNYLDIVHPSHLDSVHAFYQEHFLKKKNQVQFTFPIFSHDEGIIWLDQKMTTVWSADKTRITGYSAVARNVSEQIEIANKLRESESHYQAIFDRSPIPKRLEDFSKVKHYLDDIKRQGVVDFEVFFKENPKKIRECVGLVKVLEVNKQLLALHEAKSESELKENISQVFTERAYDTFAQELISIAKGDTLFETETTVRTIHGEGRHIQLKWMVMPGYEKTLEKVMITTVDITDSVSSAKALKESQSHYETLFHESTIPLRLEDFSEVDKIFTSYREMGVTDLSVYFSENENELMKCAAAVKLIEINKKYLNLFGVKDFGELYQDPHRFITPKTISDFIGDLNDLYNGVKEKELETEIRDTKGNLKYLSKKWTVLDSNSEGVGRVFISSVDVTEQQRSQAEIEGSQKRLSTVFQNINVPIIISNPIDARIVEVNSIAVQALGYSVKELLRMTLGDLDAIHDNPYVVTALNRCYEEGLVEGETKWRTKAGKIHDISVKNSLINIAGEDRVLSACNDITKMKQLNLENERFRIIMDNAPFAIYITDQNGKIIDVNSTVSKHLGYTKREILTLSVNDIEVPPEGNKNVKVGFEELIDEKLSITINTNHKRKSGALFPVNVTITGGKIGEEKYVVASVFDETVSNEITEQIREQNEVLKIIQTLQSEFISGSDLSKQFVGFLDSLIHYTKSAFGFIGEILHDENGDPYLKTHAITDISWDGETKKLYDKMNKEGFEFRNLSSLFGVTISTGEVCIANDPQNDTRSGGLPEGHPPLTCYLGIPIKANDELIGMVGLANRKDGYSEKMLDELKYFISTYSVMIQALRTQEDKAKTQDKLQKVNEALSSEVQHRKVAQRHSFNAEERERKRVARDLHDGLGQRLTAVKYSLGAIKNSKKLDGHLAEVLSESIKMVEGSMGEVRAISQDILPVVLSDFGLNEGLRKVCAQMTETSDVSVRFRALGEIQPLEDFVKTSLYRIGQECINNAIKYAKSGEIDVTVAHNAQEGFVQLAVHDYGIGFNPKKVKKGMGLNNIKERAEMIQAKLEIKSIVNKGTTIQVKYLF